MRDCPNAFVLHDMFEHDLSGRPTESPNHGAENHPDHGEDEGEGADTVGKVPDGARPPQRRGVTRVERHDRRPTGTSRRIVPVDGRPCATGVQRPGHLRLVVRQPGG